MLELSNLAVNYGSITALHDVSLTVEKGTIVTLIGANGAGKSTTLRTVSGLLKIQRGSIRYEAEEISNLAPHRIVERGISQVPEGRMIFANLTVRENLLMGAYLRKDRKRRFGAFLKSSAVEGAAGQSREHVRRHDVGHSRAL
jgi:branched-chain amino acid transport system ATP-binding protein